MQIDFMVDSAARPDLLQITMESLLEHVKFSGKIRWMFHEAVLRKEDSQACMKYAESLKIFDIIQGTEPPKGEGYSISKMLRHADSPYFIHWEDDHKLVRDLDLDKCYSLFENYSMINQIAFNKRQTMSEVSGWQKANFTFGEDVLCVSPHWRFSPAIWRLSWILPRWTWFDLIPSGSSNNFHWEINADLQESLRGNKTPDTVANQMGTFYMGPIAELAYVAHMGKDRSGRV